MKIETTFEGGKQKLVVSYDKKEISRIKSKMQSVGLEEATTTKGFGFGASLRYYRDHDNMFLRLVTDGEYAENRDFVTPDGMLLVDDINTALVVNHKYYNAALFRVIPDENGTVSIPMSKFLNIADQRRLVKLARFVYKNIFGFAGKVTVNLNIE